jgi:hypothetical protein
MWILCFHFLHVEKATTYQIECKSCLLSQAKEDNNGKKKMTVEKDQVTSKTYQLNINCLNTYGSKHNNNRDT